MAIGVRLVKPEELVERFYDFRLDSLDSCRELRKFCVGLGPVTISSTIHHNKWVDLLHPYNEDLAVFLVVVLSTKSPRLFGNMFHKVIDGVVALEKMMFAINNKLAGRAGLGTAPKKLISKFLSEEPLTSLAEYLSARDSGLLEDLVKRTRPKPNSEGKSQFFRMILGKEFDAGSLPEDTRKILKL